jgi:hypothetical protein
VKEAGLGPEGMRGWIQESSFEGNAGGILEILHTCLAGPGVKTAHCGYMGHIGGGGHFTTALADYFLATGNHQGAVRQVCPGLAGSANWRATAQTCRAAHLHPVRACPQFLHCSVPELPFSQKRPHGV